ncbi:MAG TPA: F0F1 ATP synthase subunit A, partial [Chitinophagales bacterium]
VAMISSFKHIFFSVLFVFSSVLLTFANEGALVHAQHEVAKVDSFVEKIDEKIAEEEAAYNPTPAVLHHVQDSHTWDVFEMTHINLPCIVYNSTDGLAFFQYAEGETIKGYTCEHGGLAREDGAFFLDFSITKNVFTMLLGALILIAVLLSVANAYKTNKGAPKGMQSLLEPVFVFLRDDVAKPGIGPKYEKFLPYIYTIFFFILINNLLGLIPVFPGGANVTGNIAVTMVLALIAFVVINLSGNKDYWMHILNPDVPFLVKFILVPVEFLGIFIKPIALMIRLFANIFAGHVIVLSLISLIFVFGNAGKSIGGSFAGAAIAIPFTLFISLIEVLVAFIQAYIFANLTSVFIGLAVAEHAHHEEAHH